MFFTQPLGLYVCLCVCLYNFKTYERIYNQKQTTYSLTRGTTNNSRIWRSIKKKENSMIILAIIDKPKKIKYIVSSFDLLETCRTC